MNSELLEAKMADAAMDDKAMAKRLHMDISTFLDKKGGYGDFSRHEIQVAKKCLHLSSAEVDMIFFGE